MISSQIIAVDTPQNIKSSIHKQVVEIICDDIKKAYSVLKEKYDTDVQIFGDRLDLVVDNVDQSLGELKSIFEKNNLQLLSHRTISPSLENVFIHLVKKAS